MKRTIRLFVVALGLGGAVASASGGEAVELRIEMPSERMAFDGRMPIAVDPAWFAADGECELRLGARKEGETDFAWIVPEPGAEAIFWNPEESGRGSGNYLLKLQKRSGEGYSDTGVSREVTVNGIAKSWGADIALEIVPPGGKVDGGMEITYSPEWDAGDGVRVEIRNLDAGVGETRTFQSGEGSFGWTPTEAGEYEFVHSTLVGGTAKSVIRKRVTYGDLPVLNVAEDIALDMAGSGEDNRRVSDGSAETVTWSKLWDGSDAVEVTVNGETLAIGGGHEGVVEWKPLGDGVYVLKHTAFAGGEGTETGIATFEVSGLGVPAPVITPADGTEFFTESCEVSISCASPGAKIYYTTNGRTPRINEQFLYNGPFEITESAKIVAVATYGDSQSSVAEADILRGDIGPLTLEAALDEPKLGTVSTGADAPWTAVRDLTAKVGHTVAKSGRVGINAESMMEAKVNGSGTMTFWWRVSCEADPYGRYSWDHVRFEVDGMVKSQLDGVTDWVLVTVTIEGAGEHTLKWTYATDDWVEPGFEDCAWVDGVVWSGSEMPSGPSVAGDSGAVVTGDVESGFVVKPGDGNRVVEVTVPEGVDAAKVTVEVTPETVSVKPNGAAVKIVREANGERHDITGFLDIPAAVDGVVNVNEATVKEEYAKEPLDVAKGAVVTLGGESPAIETAPTRAGLTYKFYEGETLDGLFDGGAAATKVGDGAPWAPGITVKGGRSGFYSIKVEK